MDVSIKRVFWDWFGAETNYRLCLEHRLNEIAKLPYVIPAQAGIHSRSESTNMREAPQNPSRNCRIAISLMRFARYLDPLTHDGFPPARE